MLWTIAGLPAQQIENPPITKAETEPPLEVEFSPEGGFYDGKLLVKLLSPGAAIYYTTTGADPKMRPSQLYRGPFRIVRTTVVRAIAVKGGKKSTIFGHAFFVEEPETTFPVVSISIRSSVLFDPVKGLFMKGLNANDTLWTWPGANFWSRKEVTANVEIFESDGQCVYRSLSGFRLFGGMSRLFPQKSMTIVARKRYGKKRIKHPIFGKTGLKKFKFLVLRNSGSDFGKTHFRDGLMTGLLDDWDIEKQDFRPAHVYINGKYWGIYNIREKINRYFLAGHQGVDKDSLDLLEGRKSRKRGSRADYLQMLQFMEKNSLQNPVNFAWVQSQMEVDNFMNYEIAQIYFDNQDAGGNIKFWRPQMPGGKWRWILYDTDWGFGLHDSEAYKNNSLAFHMKPNGPHWPNPPWSTFILRKLLENQGFERNFVNRFADHLNSTFAPGRVEKKIDELSGQLLPEISRHWKRWRLREKKWQSQVQILRNFARKRPDYLRMYLMEMFNTGGLRELKLSVTKGGFVNLDETIRVEKDFSGTYFEKIPVKLKAIAELGYRFSHWEGIATEGQGNELMLELKRKRYHLKAVFEPFAHPLAGKLMINEVSPNDKKTGDWVEFYNASEETVDLKNWIFTDSKNKFRFPDSYLAPKDYLVLCEDSAAFAKVFPKAYNFIGGMGFGLNKRKEMLSLYSPEGAAVNTIDYNLEPRDSVFTLNLLLPWLNNSDFENWEIRNGRGTPNSANPYYVESTIEAQRKLWMQIGSALAIILICVLLLVLKGKGRL